jgi:hypothetical protein
MKIWENMMNKMMEKKLSSMSKGEKMKMMETMMPKMMEGMTSEDIMGMMETMMPKMMEYFMGGEDSKEKAENIHEFMPAMMEDCMSEMDEEERKNMLSFCRGMLDKMEKKFSSSASE